MKFVAATTAIIAAIGVVSSGTSFSQQWPEKAVRILVPFPPGGGTDIQARLLSTAFQKRMGQNFIIDNRTGASGIIAAQIAVDSPPDGNTILFTSGSLSIVPTLLARQMKFNVHKDLQPVSWISSTPLVLSVHPSVPAKSVRELVALAKDARGGLSAGGNAQGSSTHLSAEMLNQAAGINTTVLFYRGGGPTVIALIAGEADYVFATAPSIMPHLKSGKARALAVTTAKRSAALPDLPTMDSLYPGFETDNWYAMFFPAGTPQAMVSKLNGEIRSALSTPEIRAFYPREALEPVASSPAELSTKLRQDTEKYARVIRAANIRIQ